MIRRTIAPWIAAVLLLIGCNPGKPAILSGPDGEVVPITLLGRTGDGIAVELASELPAGTRVTLLNEGKTLARFRIDEGIHRGKEATCAPALLKTSR